MLVNRMLILSYITRKLERALKPARSLIINSHWCSYITRKLERALKPRYNNAFHQDELCYIARKLERALKPLNCLLCSSGDIVI